MYYLNHFSLFFFGPRPPYKSEKLLIVLETWVIVNILLNVNHLIILVFHPFN